MSPSKILTDAFKNLVRCLQKSPPEVAEISP